MTTNDVASEDTVSKGGILTLSRTEYLSLCLLVLFGLWLRYPFIGTGLPYFYQEDEAHHFNRTVEMVKSGRWDPQYFHKPSLHFYLRMPVVAASFISGVREGHLRKIQEVRTRDKYGLAGYAFTASHSGIVKWNRAFSVLLSLGVITLTFMVARVATGSAPAAFLAALVATLSPDFVQYSAVIGVDIVMTFMALLGVYLGLICCRKFSLPLLVSCGIACGLAISSKYNALPIAVLPLVVACMARQCNGRAVIAALLAPIVGFFVGSPFILSSIPLFLNHLAYEVWHYGVAGHVGHSADPGLGQFLFYSRWLASSALGVIILCFVIGGLTVTVLRPRRDDLVVLTFPVLFALLMISQKANFTRNMIVLLPFLGIIASYAASVVFVRLKGRGAQTIAFVVLLVLFTAQPLLRVLGNRAHATQVSDTRDQLPLLVSKTHKGDSELALAGQLLAPPSISNKRGVSLFDQETQTPENLYLSGFDFVIFGNHTALPPSASTALSSLGVIEGVRGRQRIPRDPHFELFSFRPLEELEQALRTTALSGSYSIALKRDDLLNDEIVLRGDAAPGEDYVWASSRLSHLLLDPEISSLNLSRGVLRLEWEIMSPWSSQQVEIWSGKERIPLPLDSSKQGQFHRIPLKVPFARDVPLLLYVRNVHSPKALGYSEDTRRLGVAIKEVLVER